MQVIAFIFAIVAAVVFGYEAWLHRNVIALGLAILTVAWIVQLTVTSGTLVHLG